MGAVDRHDQMVRNYAIDRKSRKWWVRMFVNFLDAIMVNAYIVYKENFQEVITSEFDVEEVAKHYEPQKFPPRNLELLSDDLNYVSHEFQETRNNYFASLKMSKVEAELIEISTRGQSVNPKW